MIKPTLGYIILEPITPPQEGLIIPDEEDRANWGTVVGDSTHFKEGDKVMYKKHLFDEVVYRGMKLVVGKTEGIIAYEQNPQ